MQIVSERLTDYGWSVLRSGLFYKLNLYSVFFNENVQTEK